jgi:cob(I)alamin adenosyltransferase
MGYRLSKIYTRKGDDGTTSLDAKNRIAKDSAEIEALGTIDELNSAIGVILACSFSNASIRQALTQIQQELFNLSGELCLADFIAITPEKTLQLENWLDEWNATLLPLKEFLLPGGNLSSATCHLARTICRRAERRLVTLQQEKTFNTEILRYINRLSDTLFVAARILAKETTAHEPLWEHEKK